MPYSTQLSSFAKQPGCVGQGPHWNWPIVGRHTAELGAGQERCPRAQVRRTESGEYPDPPAVPKEPIMSYIQLGPDLCNRMIIDFLEA